jgi:DNA-binding transcriptional ArsR family regulator
MEDEQVFRALADPSRRLLLDRLFERDGRTLSELESQLEMTRFGVMKHLKVLEEAGLVSRSREAQRRPVHLEAEVFDLMTKWIERYRREAEERYRRLDAVLADLPDDTEPLPPTRPRTSRTPGADR